MLVMYKMTRIACSVGLFICQVPRVFINAKFVGGGSEIEALQQKGELRPLLESCGAL